jgi:hypothetical protein
VTGQDVAALVVCAIALLWLVRRLFLSYGPPSRRPDVTPRALVKRTRERKADATPRPPRGCH